MKRLLPSCLLLLVAIGFFLIATHDEPAGDAESAPDESSSNPGAIDSAAENTAVSESSPGSVATEVGQLALSALPPELADRTTWIAPYRPAFWHASGWRFAEDALVAEDVAAETQNDAARPGRCTATFLRDWQTVSAGLHVRFPPNDRDESTAGGNHRQLVLEIGGGEVSDTLRVTLQSGRVVAESVIDGHATVLRENAAADTLDGNHVRLLLTPNRLLLRVDDQLLLNAPRPAALTGTRCRFRMTAPPGTIVSDLRFDGE